MKTYLILALTATLIFPTPSQSDTNHFGAGGIFELDLGDSEIPMTPKQEREQKLLEKQLKKEEKQLISELIKLLPNVFHTPQDYGLKLPARGIKLL